MQHYKIVTAVTRDITPAFLAEFMDYKVSPTERDESRKRIDELKARFKGGFAVSFVWAVATFEGVTYRMNGQHSSVALKELQDAGEFPEGLKAHFTTYEVEHKEDLALLFRQFDPRQSSRTPADISSAYQGLEDELRPINKVAAKLGVEGIYWHERYVEKTLYVNGDDVYALMSHKAYHPFIIWLGGVLTDGTPELKKAPVIAAMHVSWERGGDKARDFWSRVAQGGDKALDDVPFKLAQWLQWAKEQKDPRKKLSPAQLYEGCYSTWTAYRDRLRFTKPNCSVVKGKFTSQQEGERPMEEPVEEVTGEDLVRRDAPVRERVLEDA